MSMWLLTNDVTFFQILWVNGNVGVRVSREALKLLNALSNSNPMTALVSAPSPGVKKAARES